MAFEIPVDLAYFRHPKIAHLQTLLGARYEAEVYPLRLWAFAAEYARTGVIEGGPTKIEAACRWRGRSGVLAKALQEAGWLEPDGKTIHDWMEHIGRAIAVYDSKKRKMREKYDREKGSLPEEKGSLLPIRDTRDRRDTQDRREEPSSATSLPSAGTPDVPKNGADVSPEAIRAAIQRRDPRMPDWKIDAEIARAKRAGVEIPELLRDIEAKGDRLKIWAIVDNYEHPSNGKTKPAREKTNENPTGYIPPVLEERREVVHARQDKGRKLADEALASMDPDELSGWTTDAEEAAKTAKIPSGPMFEAFVKGELRKRAAEVFSIEGV